MKIRCAWCKKIMGEKEPLDDPSTTDTICPECRNKYFPEKEVEIETEEVYRGRQI